MFYIGVCDDEPLILLELQKIITDICSDSGYECEVRVFETGEAILNQIEELNLAFLDIEMPGLDGIELGRRISQRNPKCKIIMATGKVERFKEAFHIKALRFVTKPFDRWEVEEALTAAMERHYVSCPIELFYQRNKYEVPQEEIQYIQTYGSSAEFLVGERWLRKEISLSDLEKVLDERLFVRLSRQYIVNLRWIHSYEGNSVYIADKRFTISRRKHKEFEQKYIEYDLKYRGEF